MPATRHVDTERLCGLEVDNQFDFRGLLDRQVGRLFALQNSTSIKSDETMRFRNARPVTHQTSGGNELARLVDRWHRVLDREIRKLMAATGEECATPDDKSANS